MEFNSRQLKIIKSKPNGYNLVKGKTQTGKTTTVLNRIPLLLNSYCLEENDSILMIVPSKKSLEKVENIYNNLDNKEYHQESFFEKDIEKHFKIDYIEKIVFEFLGSKKNQNELKSKLLSGYEKYEIILNIINNQKKIKNRKIRNVDFLIEEIKYIKSFNYSLEEYQNSNRKKHFNINIKKNSMERKEIFDIYNLYNKEIKKIDKIDIEDIYILALQSIKETHNWKFTHIIIDDVQELTKIQIEFIKALYNEKSYSSFTFIMNTDNIANDVSYLSKNNSFNNLNINLKGKTKIMYETYNTTKMIESKEILRDISLKSKTSELDKIEYVDLKRNVIHNFIKDTFNSKEIYIENSNVEEKVENLKEIPVFNEIAAGNPILMNDFVEDTYYLPSEWVRTNNDVFMLKIQGDSMINRNINDGDYVLISKDKSVKNNDIVAVEFAGEATLKTLKIEEKTIIFKPENEKYDPIIVSEDDEFNILGLAIGIIRH